MDEEKLNKDWIGNKNSVFKTLGASSHTDKEREINDYYATEPKAIDILFEVENFLDKPIWECAAGSGELVAAIKKYTDKVVYSDIVDRGYDGTKIIDFLEYKKQWTGHIITNPPYKYATEFIYKALSIVPDGCKVAMFLKVQFLEGKERKRLFTNYPPKVIYISSSRILCAKNARFDDMRRGGGSAVAYAWFVWEKGYNGETIIKWIN